MKHIRKSFPSAKPFLAFLLSLLLGATTLLHGEGILILYGVTGDTEKDNGFIQQLSDFCNAWNAIFYTSGDSTHFAFDTFSTVDEAHEKASEFYKVEECYGGSVGVFAHGSGPDTIYLNGEYVNTSEFDNELIHDSYHCLKDGSSDYTTADLLTQFMHDLGYE